MDERTRGKGRSQTYTIAKTTANGPADKEWNPDLEKTTSDRISKIDDTPAMTIRKDCIERWNMSEKRIGIEAEGSILTAYFLEPHIRSTSKLAYHNINTESNTSALFVQMSHLVTNL